MRRFQPLNELPTAQLRADVASQRLADLYHNTLLERIEARCAVENVGSQRVLEKTGFEREGRLRAYFKLRGRRMDNYLYALLRDDYLVGRGKG